MRIVSLQSHILYVSRVTPDSRMAVTLNAKIVIQHSAATSGDQLVKSTLNRSPLRVDIELVGSEGIFRTSNAMVNRFPDWNWSLVMSGVPGSAFWNM